MLKYLILLFSSLFALQIEIGDIPLEVEIADTPAARQKGLSGRKELPDGEGMLFVFTKPQIVTFWMKDTLIPLSLGVFDRNRVLVQTIDMNPPPREMEKPPTYSSKLPSLYALEVPQGWFEKHGIKLGTRFKFVKNASPDQTNPIK